MNENLNPRGPVANGNPTLKEEQYVNGAKFNARIQLHAQCATNKYPWPLWVFDQFEKKPHQKILELGCGTGLLWQVNSVRIPDDWEITLSDFSEGMVKETQANLQAQRFKFNYQVINAEQILLPDNTFDIVIANHMLYHIDDLNRALSEISRVLKPDGILYASTVGTENMLEMREMVSGFSQNNNYEAAGTVTRNFSLDNGFDFLQKYFQEIRVARYKNSLIIKDAQLLTAYVLSCNQLKTGVEVLNLSRADSFRVYAEDLIQKLGQFEVTADSGMFIAINKN